MQLRNKKTGEILSGLGSFIIQNPNHINCEAITKYDSLAELNEEWEDVPEEPKSFWTINTTFDCAEPIVSVIEISERYYDDKDAKSIGNYFETKEEAEKAVEKLKAWKRLKDKGFRFKNDSIDICCHTINFKVDRQFDMTDETSRDLHLIFGGEEEENNNDT